MRKKIWLFSSFLCLTGGAIYFALARNGGQRPTSGSERLPTLHLSFEEGMQRTYEFSYESKGGFAAMNGGSPAAEFGLKIAGTLIEQVVLVEADRVTLSYQIEKPIVTLSQGQQDEALAASVNKELQKPILAAKSFNGSLNGFWGAEKSSALTQQTFRELMEAGQFRLPQQAQGSWEAMETDGNGLHRASYRIKSTVPSGQASIEKLKSGYTEDSNRSTKVQASGFASADWLSSGEFKSINSDFSYIFRQSDQQVGQSKVTFRAELKTVQRMTPLVLRQVQLALKGNMPRILSLQKANSEAVAARLEKRMYQTALGSAGQTELLDALNAMDTMELEKKSISAPQKGEILNKLYAYFYLHPDKIKDFVESIQNKPAQSYTFRFTVGALGHEGSPKAQQSLRSLTQKFPGDTSRLSVVLPALGMTRFPVMESEQMIHTIATQHNDADVKSIAFLAYGSVGNTTGSFDAERSRNIVKNLGSELDGTFQQKNRHVFLSALGNTRNAEILKTVRRYQGDPSPRVRASLARSLRHIATEESLNILMTMLQEESDQDVKLSIVDALSYSGKDEKTLSFQEAFYERESSVAIKADILRNLWKFRANREASSHFVAERAENERIAEVRKVARNLIIGGTSYQ